MICSLTISLFTVAYFIRLNKPEDLSSRIAVKAAPFEVKLSRILEKLLHQRLCTLVSNVENTTHIHAIILSELSAIRKIHKINQVNAISCLLHESKVLECVPYYVELKISA